MDFQIFVKPVGARCNLSCRYCYYLDKISICRGESSYLMTEEVLERYILQQIKASPGKLINFSWHGGEPLLAGIDFFRKAVAIQKRHLPSGCTVINGIQTNGTLLSEEWCRFLSAEKFLVGISIDGPAGLHNKFRLTGNGRPTFNDVIKGYNLLKKYNIVNEILCVVSSNNAGSPLQVYDFFKKSGARYITFLPLVVPDPESVSGVTPDSVQAVEFGKFLSVIFDEWIKNDIGRIKIQIFEEAIRPAFNQGHTLCIFKEECGRVPVIERNGDFYSCDHYVDDDHKIGNIMDKSIQDLLNSSRQLEFGKQKSALLPQCCQTCDVKKMCNGECPKNRFITSKEGEPGLNYLCEGYKYFFRHCRQFVEAIAAVWKGNINGLV